MAELKFVNLDNYQPKDGDRWIAVYEVQTRSNFGDWSVKEDGWQSEDGVIFQSKDSQSIPQDLAFVSDWMVDPRPELGVIDEEGWEYGSQKDRFHRIGRSARAQKALDKARRRRWLRLARNKRHIRSASDRLKEMIPQNLITLTRGLEDLKRSERVLGSRNDSPAFKEEVQQMTNTLRQIIQFIREGLESLGIQNNTTTASSSSPFSSSHSHNNSTAETVKMTKWLRELNKLEAEFEEVVRSPKMQGLFRTRSRVSSESSEDLYSLASSSSSAKRRKSRKDEPSSSSSSSQDLMDVRATHRAKYQPRTHGHTSNTNGRGGGGESEGKGGEDEEDDGAFVCRQDQQLEILSKLKAEDETEVSRKIMEEREEKVMELHASMQTLHSTFADLQQLVAEQQEQVDEIVENVEKSHATTEQGLAEVKRADELQAQSSCTIS